MEDKVVVVLFTRNQLEKRLGTKLEDEEWERFKEYVEEMYCELPQELGINALELFENFALQGGK